MKNLAAALALLLLSASTSLAVPLQPWEGGTGCEAGVTVATLPAAPLVGTICTITDGLTEYDVSVGGGSKTNIAIYTGAPAGGVDFGWKQIDLDYTEVSDSFYVTQDTNGGLPRPSTIPSCRNGTDGGVLGYNTSTHAFVCTTTTRLAIVATSSDVTNGLCFWSDTYNTIQCGNGVGVTTLFSTAPIAGAFNVKFEGDVADANETILDVVEPTNDDNTILLPNASGTVAVSATSPITLSALGAIGLTAFSGDVSSSGSTLTIGADKVLESHLKAVDAAADEECLTYETTTGDFEWQACDIAAAGNSFETINAPAGTDPVADSSTDTLNLTGTSGIVTITGDSATDTLNFDLGDGTVTEAKLKAVDAPADEECFTYESTTGDFEWQSCATSVGTGTFLKLDASNDPVTDQLAISGSNPTGMLSVINTNSASGPAFTIQNSADAASVVTGYFYGSDRATAAAGDDAQIRFYIEDSAGNQQQAGSILWTLNTVTNAAENGGFLINAIAGGASLEMVRFSTPTSGQASNTFNENGVDVDFRVETDAVPNAIFCNATADSCTFGSQTELGFIGIDGSADEVQLAIQGNATQTSNILLVETSAGTDLWSVSNDGYVTNYGGAATAGRGQAAIIATPIRLAAQSATIGATTLFTPSADMLIRVSATMAVTRAATTSSTMGSLGITYQQGDSGVSIVTTMGCYNRTGAIVTSTTSNTTTSVLNCVGVYYVNSGSAVTYDMGYASSGATTMQYSLDIVVERLN